MTEQIKVPAYPTCGKGGCTGVLLPFSTTRSEGFFENGVSVPFAYWKCSLCERIVR